MTEDEEPSLTNREKSKRAKRTKFWCCKCDSQIVSLIKKCPVCGYRENKKKIKI